MRENAINQKNPFLSFAISLEETVSQEIFLHEGAGNPEYLMFEVVVLNDGYLCRNVRDGICHYIRKPGDGAKSVELLPDFVLEPGSRFVIRGEPISGTVIVLTASIIEAHARKWLSETSELNKEANSVQQFCTNGS